ncbi:MAG: peptidoglycan-binding domain-containing protein [Planctomycetota bacterium]
MATLGSARRSAAPSAGRAGARSDRARAGPGARVTAALAAAAALWGLAGCNGDSTQGQEQIENDLARLSSRLKRMESENRKLSTKVAELERILRRRAKLSPPVIPPREVVPPTGRRTDGDTPGAPKETRELTGDEFTRKVQGALKKAGLDPGPVDGKMGRLTTEAIRAFQRDNNLPETGRADKATWELLRKYLPD